MRLKKATDIDEIAAAYLLATENRSQAEIAALLGVSPPVVSRIIARVRGRYFTEELRFLEEDLAPDTLEAVRRRIARTELAERLDAVARAGVGQPGPVLRVFPSGEAQAGESALAAFAGQAAPYIRTLVLRSRWCGVTWGRMLKNVVDAIGSLRGPAPPNKIEVIPLAGEPLGNELTTSSSSTLASVLGRMLNGELYHARSLTMVPALVPHDFTTAEHRAVRKLVERLPDYDAIFGNVAARRKTPMLAEQIDCILTSVGHTPLGFSLGSLLDKSEQQLFVGDIGGVLIPRAALARGQRKKTKDIEARWTGLRFEQLEACAARSRARAKELNGPPGVVLISVGAERAPVVVEAVRRGLANHLVIDSRLEYALAALVK